MEFLKKILSKLGQAGLGEKAVLAAEHAKGLGAKGLNQIKQHPAASGALAGLGAGGAYAAMKGGDDDEEEGEMSKEELMQMLKQKASKKARSWMDE